MGVKTPQRCHYESPHTEPLVPRLGKEGRETREASGCEHPAARVVPRERLFPGVGASRCLHRNTGPASTRVCTRTRTRARQRGGELGARSGGCGREASRPASLGLSVSLSLPPGSPGRAASGVAPAGARPDSPPGSGTGPGGAASGPAHRRVAARGLNALSPRDVRGRRREASRSRDVAGHRVSGLLTGSGSPLAGTPVRSLLGVCCGRDARRFFFQSLDGQGGTAATAAPTRAKWRQLRRLLELSPVCAGAEPPGGAPQLPGVQATGPGAGFHWLINRAWAGPSANVS